MIKNILMFIAIFLAIHFVNAQESNWGIDFIGYDGKLPLFASISRDASGVGIGHVGIYMFANERLTKVNVSVPKGSRCLAVKNNIYVFGDTLDGSTRLRFKLNGNNLIYQLAIKSTHYLQPYVAAINDEYFFIITNTNDMIRGKRNSTILRIKYRTPSKMDTIRVNGYCVSLLDANNDFLYYTDQDTVSDNFSPDGNAYQMNLKNGNINAIAMNICNLPEVTAITPHLNLFFSGDYKFPSLTEYKKNVEISSKNETTCAGIFYSYERNAFINYYYSSDINSWECFHLGKGGDIPTEFRGIPCFGKK